MREITNNFQKLLLCFIGIGSSNLSFLLNGIFLVSVAYNFSTFAYLVFKIYSNVDMLFSLQKGNALCVWYILFTRRDKILNLYRDLYRHRKLCNLKNDSYTRFTKIASISCMIFPILSLQVFYLTNYSQTQVLFEFYTYGHRSSNKILSLIFIFLCNITHIFALFYPVFQSFTLCSIFNTIT